MALPRTRVLRGSLTQGAADAFATGQIDTGLFGAESSGLMIRRITMQLTVPFRIPADADLAVNLVRGAAPTVISQITNPPTIFCYTLLGEFITAAGVFPWEGVRQWSFPEDSLDQLIVEPAINMVIDSTATGVVNTVLFRIECVLIPISQIDRLTLIELANLA